MIEIRELRAEDIEEARGIWNSVVESGTAFPQMETLSEDEAERFFSEQSYTAVAVLDDAVVGLYILHPNNVGRCGHICNCSFAVKKDMRGHHIGRSLVLDAMERGRSLGFRIMQFNAVVRTNHSARHLYESLGFIPLGIIPGGFLLADGSYEDIIPYYKVL